ncbi:arylamine N-acetyltransferase [Ciceribacter sp. L1K22]|uniref:arylamine N-acetyltransferase family protein n=1 Tax=Ciceribacter sp. L1K22 TaxID=2820275 RepID=UPI001ABEA4E7|nr:arylamine N-acetyltransferase [Ciceribacter sp. L1K22]MBO3759876.1 arylamine N-acetyltransferase [Ciceribacter sp. L1K22]
MTFDIQHYLNRIGLDCERIDTTPQGLARLQRAQISSIAFENMDPLTGTVPDIDPAALWTKLIVDRRGGYCLELNRLFAEALTALGFTVAPFLGRVRKGASVGGARTHHMLIVSIDGEEYLADSGFGGQAPVEPVKIGTSEPQTVGHETFRVRWDDATGEHVLERLNGETWFALYSFDRAPVAPLDFEAANVVCARWDKAPFPFHLMMTIATPEGRNNLFNRDLKRIRNGAVESVKITTLAEFEHTMSELFLLPPNAELYLRVWDKIAVSPSSD